MIDILDKIVYKASKIGSYFASVILSLLVVLILVEIVSRTFFHSSTMLADEYSGYFFLALSFFGMPYTFMRKGHIRINFLTSRFSDANKELMNVFAGIIGCLILGFALVASFRHMMDSKEMEILSEGVSETPIYLTQIPIVLGLFLFLLAMIVFTIKRMGNDS